jgi:hypothetical protein
LLFVLAVGNFLFSMLRIPTLLCYVGFIFSKMGFGGFDHLFSV